MGAESLDGEERFDLGAAVDDRLDVGEDLIERGEHAVRDALGLLQEAIRSVARRERSILRRTHAVRLKVVLASLVLDEQAVRVPGGTQVCHQGRDVLLSVHRRSRRGSKGI